METHVEPYMSHWGNKYAYTLLWSFILQKKIFFLPRFKIIWVGRNVPTIILVYGNTFWTKVINRPQKGPNMVLNGRFSQLYSQYPIRVDKVRSRYHSGDNFFFEEKKGENYKIYWLEDINSKQKKKFLQTAGCTLVWVPRVPATRLLSNQQLTAFSAPWFKEFL